MPSHLHPANDRFATTRWSLVARARGADETARIALEELCALYWPPVYAYYRRRGLSSDDAADRTQGLFTDLLERDDLLRAQPAQGRFRAWLLACAKHFEAKQRERANAAKRGGGRLPFSLDVEREERALGLEPADETTPEDVFERRWARAVLDRALDALAAEYAARGRESLFQALRGALEGELDEPYAAIAARLDRTEGAIKVAVHRLRARLRELLLAEVGQTVDDPEAAAAELRALAEALGRDASV